MVENEKYFWLEDPDEHGWVPAKIHKVNLNNYILHANISDEIIEYELDKYHTNLIEVHRSCLEGVDDLINLGELNEPTLLQNTRARFYKDKIYSFIGSQILLSLNPYKKIDIYNIDYVNKFRKKFSIDENYNKLNSKSEPHLFHIAESCYLDVIHQKKNQSIIICGESGSGKTEATKIILKYLAIASEIVSNENAIVKNEETLEKHLLDSNPLLEAFGNAKTLMNNNSSRFGKFILVSFNENGKICSAKIFNYFLEKSRIVKVHPNERNYHIFYQFLKGASETEIKKFKLKEPSYFNYLNKGCLDIDEIDDKMNFLETKECLVRLKFTKDEIELIFSTLIGILYLGNIQFILDNGCIKINDNCKEDLLLAIELLGSDSSTMIKILTMRSMLDPLSKKQIDKQMSLEECNYSRDVIAKTVYSKMFDWIIKKVNKAISSSIDKEKNTKLKKIGILDIFGFEVFEENSFEQLCINYANERLQQLFNNQILKMEQEEYIKENIDFNNLIYKDNKDILELIDNPQKSLFSLLDSQTLLKNNNDYKFREQVYSTLSENKKLALNMKTSDTITICHYAGEVDYNINGFIEKNNDQLNNDVIKALQFSKNKLIKYLFKNKKVDLTESSPGKLNSDTLSKQFKKQLDELIKILSQSNPRYIKCIKPNKNKKPGSFQSLEVNRQLLCAGVLETVNIRKIGLSTRILLKEFVQKYQSIVKGFNILMYNNDMYKSSLEIIRQIKDLNEYKDNYFEPKHIQIGTSKVLMKDEIKHWLDGKINEISNKNSLKIQTKFRGFKSTKNINKLRTKCIIIEKGTKEFKRRFKKFINKLILQVVFDSFIHKRFNLLFNPIKNKYSSFFKEKNNNIQDSKGKSNCLSPKIGKNNSTNDFTILSKEKKEENKDNINKSKYKKNTDETIKFIQFQLIENEYIAKIESLTKENLLLKTEKLRFEEKVEQLNSQIISKDNEIAKMRTNVDNYTLDESLKLQIELLEENLKYGFERKPLSTYSVQKNEELTNQIHSLDEELKKHKNDLFEKDAQNYALNLQVTELSKSNKYLNELCDNLKNQIKRNKDKLDQEFKFFYEQKKEFEKERDLYRDKINESNFTTVETELKKQINDLNQEKKHCVKKYEDLKKRNENEFLTYKNSISSRDRKIQEFIIKLSCLENELNLRNQEFDNLKKEHYLCLEMKSKNEINYSSTKMTESNANSVKEHYENILSQKNRAIKRFENEIYDLNKTIENLKKIEIMLKQELNKKDSELTRCNEILKSVHNDNEKLTDENIHFKKELLCLKNINPTNRENDVINLRLKIVELEKRNTKILSRIDKKKQIIKNKVEQNNSMIDLLKVMKKEIALFHSALMKNNLYTCELQSQYKEIKNEEHKYLHFIQKFAEEEFSESEAEYDGIYA